MLERTGGLPDVVTACVGGGSNAIGMFAEFIDEPSVELVGVEPAGEGLTQASTAPPSTRDTSASFTVPGPT